VTAAHAQSWSLSGNAVNNANFLGTTNLNPLVFKVGGLKSGYIDTVNTQTSFGFKSLANSNAINSNNSAFGYNALANTTGSSNTAIGYKVLINNTTGGGNTASGSQALYYNAQGSYNVATGITAMLNNVSGSYNVASGVAALYNNNGSYNTASGYEALRLNTAGTNNTATGAHALRGNKTGIYNTAMGSDALLNNAKGSSNAAFGYSSLKFTTSGGNTGMGAHTLEFNTTGTSNSALGYSALWQNTVGFANTALGDEALRANTTGDANTAVGNNTLLANLDGNYNVAIGDDALANSNSNNNTVVGSFAMYYNTKGSSNTAMGYHALYNNKSGNSNTALGNNAGADLHNTTFCTFIGNNADANAADYFSSTALGNGSLITADNQVRVGNTSIVSIGGYRGWTTLPSDKRFKKDVAENIPGLTFINLLKPVSYHLDINALDNYTNPDKSKSASQSTEVSVKEKLARDEKAKELFSGFIAQDVEAAAKKIGYDFSGIDAPKNSKDVYGLRYAEFVIPLVKAVQELSGQNEELKKENEKIKISLQKQIDELKAMITAQQSPSNNQRSAILTSASLSQNIPNPFINSTTINYTLPTNHSSAKIIITDKSGKTVKEISVFKSGYVTINASTLSSGAYVYSLYVDGFLIASKQMITSK
ncbi:MAG: tail fiber domain-containing protein, partial [Parafilimonas sp.]